MLELCSSVFSENKEENRYHFRGNFSKCFSKVAGGWRQSTGMGFIMQDKVESRPHVCAAYSKDSRFMQPF